MTDLTMPRLSDSMEEGTILKWLKNDGEEVAAGEDVVEIETDKATMTHATEVAGVLTIVAAEGETVPLGALIARIGAEAASNDSRGAAAGAGGLAEATAGADDPVDATATADGAEVRASPVARRLAREHGLVLDHVVGTGPRGRIMQADVAAAAGIAAPPSKNPAPTPPVVRTSVAGPVGAAPGSRDGVTQQPISRLQQAVARRMLEAKTQVPDFHVQIEAVMDAAIALRSELKEIAGGDPVASVNDIVIKAVALALGDFPRANGSYTDGGFELHERVNVGIAVAADDGLVVPTIFDADSKPLGQIARETRAVADRVRTGQITPPELDGGTFTVSNLGMFGITAVTPIINPPQAAILGVGALREVLARVDGAIVDRTVLTLTLSCDHRILYGAEAAGFLARIRELLEQPLKLLL